MAVGMDWMFWLTCDGSRGQWWVQYEVVKRGCEREGKRLGGLIDIGKMRGVSALTAMSEYGG
jgi:hypothetical protein